MRWGASRSAGGACGLDEASNQGRIVACSVRQVIGHTRDRRPQERALDALDRACPSEESELVFPSERGGYLDVHHFRPHQWRPSQRAAGIDPLRRIYDLRHTFATLALRAGISTFDRSRFMGASLTMIDRHYGHLPRDGSEHAIRLLDELSAEQRPPWTLVDARWTLSERVPAKSGNTNGA